MCPKISVIVPVHNVSEYLHQCIGTIVNQTFHNIEIICVDDGSTDDSWSILSEFAEKDNRMYLIHREQASGSGALPRNMGLEKASGKYVMFLDSDDYFDLTLLEKLYEKAEAVNADLVMCDNYRMFEDTEMLSTENTELRMEYVPDLEVFSYKDIKDHIFQISTAAVWHKLILRDLLIRSNLEFQLEVPILDDIYFVNSLLVMAERIAILPERLIYYRVLRAQAQTTTIGKHKESIFKAFYSLNQFLIEKNIYEDVKKSLQIWTLSTMSWWMHSISDFQTYAELFDLYKKEYFEKLGLMEICFETLKDDNIRRFYDSIVHSAFCPSLRVILESILHEESDIVIYGAGEFGKRIYSVVDDYEKHNIVLWCDKNAANINDSRVKEPIEIKQYHVDAVLVAIVNPDIVREVKEYLKKIGVDEQIIYQV